MNVILTLQIIYYLPILHSAKLDRFYIGFTSNLEARFQKHLSNHKGYTSRAKDWEIVYSEKFESKIEAEKREKQIKNWKSKQMIIKLIAQNKV